MIFCVPFVHEDSLTQDCCSFVKDKCEQSRFQQTLVIQIGAPFTLLQRKRQDDTNGEEEVMMQAWVPLSGHDVGRQRGRHQLQPQAPVWSGSDQKWDMNDVPKCKSNSDLDSLYKVSLGITCIVRLIAQSLLFFRHLRW